MSSFVQANDVQPPTLEVGKCGADKNTLIAKANKIKAAYERFSPQHKTCRAGEAGALSEKMACWEVEADKKKSQPLLFENHKTGANVIQTKTSKARGLCEQMMNLRTQA